MLLELTVSDAPSSWVILMAVGIIYGHDIIVVHAPRVVIYSTCVIHDDRHLQSSYFYSTGQWVPYSQHSNALQLLNGPSKLECYITLPWKGVHWINTLAHWAHL